MLGMGPEEDKFENGGHGGFLESFKVWTQAEFGLLWKRAKKENGYVIGDPA
jgi:hypothetical protein